MEERIVVADRLQDDLTRIDGLGPFLAQKLNTAGIFTYDQIAAWTPEQVADITTRIGYIPGRIEQDGWVRQAKRLAETRGDAADIASYEAVATKEDLKIIEGIGPKIEEILYSAGIYTWETLANSDPGQIKTILEAAGDQYRMHNPYTWPLQARLAAADKWEELKAYQEELRGGREQ
ncbi:MAG: helix-hairpin-helix domain-containing protein [Saprospiraceae bacterium]